MKKRILALLFVISLLMGILSISASAAEPVSGTYQIADSKGNIYTLSKPLIGFTYNDIAGYMDDETGIIYVISAGTTVTAPDGIRFTFVVGENLLFPEASWGDAPNTDTMTFDSAAHINKLNTSVNTGLTFMTVEEALDTVAFSDVKTGDWFFEPVNWAVQNGITKGTSETTFSPNQTCTHSQVLTFLWRAAGEPKATISNPYRNAAITPNQYYYEAMLWAWETGLVWNQQDGSSDQAAGLDPYAACKRSEFVTYLWNLTERPNAAASDFSDVSPSSAYAAAVSWAVESGVTMGTSATTFSPEQICTRSQIVTFLHRYFTSRLITVSVTSQEELDALPYRSDADRITKLYAVNAGITDISALRSLTNLTYLELYFNSISNIDALSELTNLTYLGLSANKIKDIRALKGLTNLTKLDLSSNSSVSEIEALSSLYNLQTLKLKFNDLLTQTQINALKAKLPACQIKW